MTLKKTLILLCIVFIFSSCGKDKDNYTINGKIDGVKDSTEVTLNTIGDNKMIAIDTSLVINGGFTFNGTAGAKDIHFINVKGFRSSIGLMLENANIGIIAYKDSLHRSKVSGTKDNELLVEYTNYVSNFKKVARNYQMAYINARREQDSAKMDINKKSYDSLVQENVDYDLKFIDNNPNALMSVFVLDRNISNKSIDIEKAKAYYENLAEDLKQTRSGKSVFEKLYKETQVQSPVKDSIPNN